MEAPPSAETRQASQKRPANALHAEASFLKPFHPAAHASVILTQVQASVRPRPRFALQQYGVQDLNVHEGDTITAHNLCAEVLESAHADC